MTEEEGNSAKKNVDIDYRYVLYSNKRSASLVLILLSFFQIERSIYTLTCRGGEREDEIDALFIASAKFASGDKSDIYFMRYQEFVRFVEENFNLIVDLSNSKSTFVFGIYREINHTDDDCIFSDDSHVRIEIGNVGDVVVRDAVTAPEKSMIYLPVDKSGGVSAGRIIGAVDVYIEMASLLTIEAVGAAAAADFRVLQGRCMDIVQNRLEA